MLVGSIACLSDELGADAIETVGKTCELLMEIEAGEVVTPKVYTLTVFATLFRRTAVTYPKVGATTALSYSPYPVALSFEVCVGDEETVVSGILLGSLLAHAIVVLGLLQLVNHSIEFLVAGLFVFQFKECSYLIDYLDSGVHTIVAGLSYEVCELFVVSVELLHQLHRLLSLCEGSVELDVSSVHYCVVVRIHSLLSNYDLIFENECDAGEQVVAVVVDPSVDVRDQTVDIDTGVETGELE